MKARLALGVFFLCVTGPLSAQSVFVATHSATLPTAAPSRAGDVHVEISHRFGYLSGGASDLWGLDGFVLNRLGLAVSPADHFTVGILRSNSADNLELNARIAGLAFDAPTGRFEFAAQVGTAWNLQVEEDDHGGHQHATGPGVLADVDGLAKADGNETQAYAQAIVNAILASRLALGVVPTLLWNPSIQDYDPETTVSIGTYGQLYLDRTWSLFGEWIFSQARKDQEYDSGSAGVEIRTRGHQFKLLVTNQHQMNPTQSLAGAADDFFDPGSWRFGFNLHRKLRF